jgi:hypothetical protein
MSQEEKIPSGRRVKLLPIFDTITNTVYRSRTALGRVLAAEYGFDPLDHFVYYKIAAKTPSRFRDATNEELAMFEETKREAARNALIAAKKQWREDLIDAPRKIKSLEQRIEVLEEVNSKLIDKIMDHEKQLKILTDISSDMKDVGKLINTGMKSISKRLQAVELNQSTRKATAEAIRTLLDNL